MIAGHADHAFHKGLRNVRRIAKYDDVPVLRLFIGKQVFAERPGGEAYASLSTSRWSPISRVSSIEAVGMTNACTIVVVPNSSSRMVTVHSAIAPRGGSAFEGGVFASFSVGGLGL